MKTKYIQITKFTLAMLILLIVQFSNVVAQQPLPPTATNKCVSGNCENGKGKMVYANGDTYEGDFVNGKREGQGTLTYKNGEIYIGQFANNIFNGRGKLTFFGGEIYDGNWVDDKFNGKGKLTFLNGNIYDGDFVNDKKEGQGTYTYKNGDYYTGAYKKDKQNGYGKYYAKATNTTQEGTWKDGVLVSAAKNTVTPNASNPDTAVNSKTATLLRETLNGKFDLMEGKPLVYVLINKKTNETLRYQIEFINDGGKLAFKWKESTKNEQSEKLIITDKALASATKYINFFNAKTSISPDNEIAFILSQTLYGKLKSNKEISIDFGTGPKTMSFFKKSFEPLRKYNIKTLALLHLQSGDGMTQIKILDDPICPLIVEINMPLYKFKLQG